MIMDRLTQFCDADSVAAAAGTALIGDVIDIQNLRDLGQGNPIYLVIRCQTEIITGGTAGTIAFQFASDAQAAIATDGSATVHFATDTFVTDDTALTELTDGSTIAIFALPLDHINTYERYLGILAIVATTTTTAGNIDAFLTMDVAAWKAYADGQN